ncbi:MAG: hypothetical protein K6G11_02505 [Lachnospiraceae bacterium]|nr:hypothetical protein [Lachnospiraceae bacterium]
MDENGMVKKSPAGAAVALGVIGILVSIILGAVFGVGSGLVSLIFGIIAIILGSKASKITEGLKGKGGKITGVFSIIFGIITIIIFASMGAGMSAYIKSTDRADEMPLMIESCSGLTFGVVGMTSKIDPDKTDDLRAELDILQEVINNGATTTTTSAE